MNDMSIDLDDVIDLREACAIAGFGMRTMYDCVKNGRIRARQTPSGTWFTTRQEAMKLKKRDPGRKKRITQGA